MYIAPTADVIAAEHRRRAEFSPMPVRLCRFLVEAWLHHIERRIERDVRSLGHEGALDDMLRSAP